MEKQCLVCKKMFHTCQSSFKKRKTCSFLCSKIFKSITTKGKPKSEEHKRKIGLAHLGKKRPPFSKEWRNNLSKARKGKKFTLEHCKKIGDAQRGEKSNNWKDGIAFTQAGYIQIYNPTHPSCTKRNYVLRSHLVIEKHLGRYLTSEEVVHHKGIKYPINSIENRQDDRIENLQLCENQSAHLKIHKLPPPSDYCRKMAILARKDKTPWNKGKKLHYPVWNKGLKCSIHKIQQNY